jgi:hypothetical protein
MKVGDKKLIPDYDPDELNTVIKTQRKIIDYMKDRKLNKLYSCLIVIDDQADDPRFVRHSKLLHCFFTRGRHHGISLICSRQYNVLAPIIRLNASSLYIFRLKHISELPTFIDENSAIVDKDRLREIYNLAVNDQPFSFLFVNMNAKDINHMFYIRFEKVIHIEDNNI